MLLHMNLSILGYTFDSDILMFIVLIYLVMAVHTVCGCCSQVEGFATVHTKNVPTPTFNEPNWNEPSFTHSEFAGNALANTQFKPECCPSAYSTGSGCACLSKGKEEYLSSRGGNNVPYSEY
jgi:hypothetical protein